MFLDTWPPPLRDLDEAARMLKDGLFWELWELSFVLEEHLRSIARDSGLTRAGLEVLVELWGAPEGLTQVELSRRLRVQAPTISSTVKTLLRRGYIERQPDDDGRAWRVLRAPGAPMARAFHSFVSTQESLTSGLSPIEAAAMRAVLERFTERLRPFGALPRRLG